MSRSVFRCIAGCAGDYPLDEVIYRCPTCGDLLEVVHDLEALARAAPPRGCKLFDERYLRTHVALRLRRVGQEGVGRAPRRATRTSSRCSRAARNLLWAERYGRSSGSATCWVKQCGNSHTGSFKDLGMTVLVSTVKQMIADGKPIRAVACASTGDTSAALAAYGAAAGHPRGGAPAARQDLDRAAGAAARQRRARARARHRLRRLHGDRAAARRGGGRLPRELDELAAPRGPEDRRDRDRASSSTGRCPTGS